MKSTDLARHFVLKYAQEIMSSSDGGDTSLGAYINPEKTLILKEKLLEVYDKLSSDIGKLPMFIELHEKLHENKKLPKNPILVELDELIEKYAEYVESNNLKNCFSYSIRLIEVLNSLRNNIKNLPREEIFSLEEGIKHLQDQIWKESKRILNLHDLKGLLLDFPKDVEESVSKLVPTWDFGPGINPAYKKIKKRRYETPNALLNRLLKENEDEKKGNK